MTRAHKNIRVLICNRHTLLRDGLKALFRKQPPIEIVGDAGTAKKAIELAQHLRPDVVLLDIEMPDSSGFETMVRILAIDPNIKVLVLTLSSEQQAQAQRCLEAGASGEIGMKAMPSQLRAAIIGAVGRRRARSAMSSGVYSLNAVRRG